MVLPPASFRFSAPMDPRVAGGTTRRSSRPDWVLLHNSARIFGHRNATTAECRTTEGQPIQVSFWLVDPPGVSYFSVHCPGLDAKDFALEPYVTCADAALVLFSVDFTPLPGRTSRDPGRRCTHRFVYRAGPGKPSLHPVPDPDIARPNGLSALLPCGSERYAVVFLHRRSNHRDKARYYDLHLFSSLTRAWSSKVDLPGLSEDDQKLLAKASHATSKVIKVGASSLGFVDLSWGILLVRDVFSDCPGIKYIPLPASRVCNMDHKGYPYIAPEYCCDVSAGCSNFIKFVEVEFDDRGRRSLGNQGWKATVWNRDVDGDDWHVRSSLHVANISVHPSYSDLLPELWNDRTKELELKKLVFYTPTLTKEDDDFLYVLCKLNCEDVKAWVLSVDMKHMAVEAIAPCSIEGNNTLAAWHYPCTFPKYLELIPEDDVTQNFKSISMADCVLQVMLTQDWFMELDKCLESEGATYDECRSLLHSRPVSSLLLDIQEVVKDASGYGESETTSKAADICSRALEDFDVQLKSPSDPLSCTEALRSRISVALGALDSFLRTVPATVRVLADACHEERRRAKSELCHKPGQMMPGHTTDMSYGWFNERTKQNNNEGNKRNQLSCCLVEQAAVPDGHQLRQSKNPSYFLMIFWLLSAYLLTPVVLKLLGHHPAVQ
ncbi:uncharacterized protein LOC124667481 [Lolium rigidum]|uniref:uncharacterized protein LOC124667481 n=1 Tax=Lolium rigidum TaxID=89674 RepID=UPI001F5D6F6A|nr:uncharacterized protein LOC124667481 [Lolium rigidum]